MPNCEWGKPCDCIDCRTIYKDIQCPQCGFMNTVSIIRNVQGQTTDRKGLRSYDFIIPSQPVKDLTCFKCGLLITEVGYYTELDTDACDRNIKRENAVNNGLVCNQCGKVEGIDCNFPGLVKLTRMDGLNLCQHCLIDFVKKNTPNPSDDRTKYEFDNKKLVWVPSKIKQACVSCGKERWLNFENQYKKLCSNCYRQK